MIAEALTWLHMWMKPKVELITSPDGDGYWVAVSDDFKATKQLGSLRIMRVHGFDDVESFAEWLNRHADPKDTDVLVGLREMNAGLSPSKAEQDVVSCQMMHHPRADRWRQAFSTRLTQKALYRLLVATA